jgi:hypothetical protein
MYLEMFLCVLMIIKNPRAHSTNYATAETTRDGPLDHMEKGPSLKNTLLPRAMKLKNGLSPEPVRHFARLDESTFFVELAEGVECFKYKERGKSDGA